MNFGSPPACSYLWHFGLVVSSEKSQIVDFILHHKVLLFPFKILFGKRSERYEGENIKQADFYKRTYVRFTPEDKNLRHHFEKFSGICVRFLQPFGPVKKRRATMRQRNQKQNTWRTFIYTLTRHNIINTASINNSSLNLKYWSKSLVLAILI